jgi:hypothetical protein
VIILKKEEFMRLIDGCNHPGIFNQNLLDNASVMFSKWGMSTQMDEKEHLFKSSGLDPKPEDNDVTRKEKKQLRCVCEMMMDSQINRKDAAAIIKNFNNIKDPKFEWVD